jgi:hypothetical protein
MKIQTTKFHTLAIQNGTPPNSGEVPSPYSVPLLINVGVCRETLNNLPVKLKKDKKHNENYVAI